MQGLIAQKLQQAFGRFSVQDLDGAERLCREVLVDAPNQPDALHLLGIVRLVCGQPAEAITLIRRALDLNPRDAALLENLGLAHLSSGDAAAAEPLFRRALAQGAAHGQLHMRLGMALGAQGRAAEAVKALRDAAGRAPSDATIQVNLGNALAGQGQADEALACYRRALALQPGYADAHYNIGTLYRTLGRNDEAAAAYQATLKIAPDHADALHNLGAVHQSQGRLDEAMTCYRKVLTLDRNHVASLNALGNALHGLGRTDEAIPLYEHAMQSAPGQVDAYINLGAVRAEQGRHTEARTSLERALAVDPAAVEAHCNLGDLLLAEGTPAAAAACYRRALALDGNRSSSHVRLGNASRQIGDLAGSVDCYRKALSLDPDDVTARFNLAESLKLLGSLDDAASAYREVLERNADHAAALSSLVHVRQHMCSWDGLAGHWEKVRAVAAGGGGDVSPFSLMSFSTSAAEQLACAEGWARRHVEALAPARRLLGFDFSKRRRINRLRVGYLSWGFHHHATSYWAAELFELHDRARFEIIAYDYGPDDASDIRTRLRAACDRFTGIAGDSHIAAARRIYDDQVDLLVDLTGYTLGSRPQIVALKPAPVQVNWFYPGTMGTPLMDYFVADSFVVPDGSDRYYSERVVRLPDCYMITDRKREASAGRGGREACGLPPDATVLCCFNQGYKILPDMFAVWMRILRGVPGSVLWLAEANRWQVENLRREAAALGVEAGRIVFAPRGPLAEYLAQYRLADLALDTFPYTSHTTAADALWMGCPLLTCSGETFASRVAGSVLVNAGLRELVVESLADYERAAINLARAPGRLAGLRRQLEATRSTVPMFDTSRFVRNLENAYESMFETFLERAKGVSRATPAPPGDRTA